MGTSIEFITKNYSDELFIAYFENRLDTLGAYSDDVAEIDFSRKRLISLSTNGINLYQKYRLIALAREKESKKDDQLYTTFLLSTGEFN